MAANTITRGRLRRLADVHPDRGRVLSVFLNLDPSELPTPAARSSRDHLGPDRGRPPRRGAPASSSTTSAPALQADVERVREVLGGDVAANGTRAVAVFACQPEDLLEVVALRHPLDSRVVLDDRPTSSRSCTTAPPSAGACCCANRRVARLFTGDGDELEETDRIEDDVHRRTTRAAGRRPTTSAASRRRSDDHLAHTAEVAFALYKRRGFDRLLVGAPEELVGDLEAKLHPYLRERLAGRVHLRRRALRRSTRCARCAGEQIAEHARRARARGARPARRGRRPRRPRRRRPARACSPRSTRRASRCCWSRAGCPRAGVLRPGDRAAVRDARGRAGRRDRDAGRRRRREGDREGDRAVGRRCIGRPPPRRPRAARRDRRRPALLGRLHGPRARRRRLPERLRAAGRRAGGLRRRRDRRRASTS